MAIKTELFANNVKVVTLKTGERITFYFCNATKAWYTVPE